jgi:hypothetical protein
LKRSATTASNDSCGKTKETRASPRTFLANPTREQTLKSHKINHTTNMFSLNHSTFRDVLPKINKGRSIALNKTAAAPSPRKRSQGNRNSPIGFAGVACFAAACLYRWIWGVAFASRMAGRDRMRSADCKRIEGGEEKGEAAPVVNRSRRGKE